MFYHYSQNNSGGSFTSPAIHVIIEAKSAREANDKAESIGLYFNGVFEGFDCDCCGDRWSTAYDGDEKPDIYGQSPFEYVSKYGSWATDKIPFAVIHYLDGTVKTIEKEKVEKTY